MRSPVFRKSPLLPVVLLFASAVFGQTAALNEYQLKAVFLYNFTKFVEWPPNTFKSPSDPLVIGILGPDPFGDFLGQTIKGENVNGHSLLIKHLSGAKDINQCQILFVPRKGDVSVQEIQNMHLKNVLIVGETSAFVNDGGMISILTENGKSKIQINRGVVQDSGLTISSRLLKLAELVGDSN